MTALRRIVPALTLCVLAADSSAAVLVRLTARGGMGTPPAGVRLILQPAGDDRSAPAREREIPFAGNEVALDEAAGSRWTLAVVAQGVWAQRVAVEFPPAAETRIVDILLWPAARVHGRLKFPPDDRGGASMRVLAESPPHPEKTPEIARGTLFDCTTSADRTWACVVPATALDIVLRVDGYAPIYRWGISPAPGTSLDFGELRLRRGASVTAWLDRDSAMLLDGPATATLARMIAAEASPTAARLRAPVAEEPFDARGVAQLVSLPPGTYVLTVKAKGFAAARAFPIEVFEGKETALRKPITLQRPLTIALAVQPPKDPAGKPWHIDLRRLNDFGTGADAESLVSARVDDEGRAVVPEQTPGAFHITVADSARNVFARRTIEVRDDAREVAIDVPVTQVSGDVRLGDEPLRATLWFGGRNTALAVRFNSGNDGAFTGSLPNAGRWSVEVSSESPKIETILQVDVDPERELHIGVPDTTVRGRVDAGDVASGLIEVTADVSGRPVTIRADADRAFTFRGLPEGTVSLVARDLQTGRHSARVETTTRAGESRDGIVLTLRSTQSTSGHVTSNGTAVTGARVAVTALAASPASPQVKRLSDEHGAFTLDVPADTNRLRIVVSAPGRTLHAFDVPITGSPLLDVAATGGTLDLTWPRGRFPQIAYGDIPLALPDLVPWAQRHGALFEDGRLRVPHVAPGPYRLCTAGAAGTAMRCQEGVVAPGGMLTLTITP